MVNVIMGMLRPTPRIDCANGWLTLFDADNQKRSKTVLERAHEPEPGYEIRREDMCDKDRVAMNPGQKWP